MMGKEFTNQLKFYQLCLNVCIEQNNRYRNEGMQSDGEKKDGLVVRSWRRITEEREGYRGWDRGGHTRGPPRKA